MKDENIHFGKGKNAYVEPEKEVVTLYQFSSGDHWRCSFCDSENPNTTNKCEVCGSVRIEPQKTEEHVPEQNKTVKEENTNVISNGHNVYEFIKGKLIVLICIVAIILAFVIIGKLSTYKYDSRSKIIADKLTTESTTQWKIGYFKCNKSGDDEETDMDYIPFGTSKIYYHFVVYDGPTGEELNIHSEIYNPGSNEPEYCDSDEGFPVNSSSWLCEGYENGTALAKGTHEVRFYNKDTGEYLGKKTIVVKKVE